MIDEGKNGARYPPAKGSQLQTEDEGQGPGQEGDKVFSLPGAKKASDSEKRLRLPRAKVKYTAIGWNQNNYGKLECKKRNKQQSRRDREEGGWIPPRETRFEGGKEGAEKRKATAKVDPNKY